MDKYSKLAKIPVFSIRDVERLTNNIKSAYSALSRMTKRGQVKKIRENIYSYVNPATAQIVATRYQVACAVTNTAYISHHSALEYYGLANQVYYEVYVSSDTKFREFEFEGIAYKYVASKVKNGVTEAKNTTGVRITNLERTVIDSIKDFEKIGGFEELINGLEGIHFLDETKLKIYLDCYDLQVLYQKTGYLLGHYKKEMQLSDAFIQYCKSKIGKSTRYLLQKSTNDTYYNSEWKLIVPEGLFEIGKPGGDELA
ncbi:MAG: type IV toxin-antitoxin system AbiEi family antitoxin [Sphaerochaetaceae bacterium]